MPCVSTCVAALASFSGYAERLRQTHHSMFGMIWKTNIREPFPSSELHCERGAAKHVGYLWIFAIFEAAPFAYLVAKAPEDTTSQTSTSNHETSNFGSTWQAWQDPRGCTLTAPFDNPVSLSSNQASKQKETMGLGNINGYQGILRQPSAKELCIVALEISFLHTYCSAYCQDNFA